MFSLGKPFKLLGILAKDTDIFRVTFQVMHEKDMRRAWS